MTCYIVEDEPLALANLIDYLKNISQMELIGYARDPVLALQEIEKMQPEVLFIDINMPKMNGLELLDNLQQLPLVVFTTAYDEYALTSYNYEAVDYLLKPFRLSRLMKCVQRLEKRNHAKKGRGEATDTLVIPDGRKKYIVNKAELKYIKSDRDYLEYHLTDSMIVSIGTLRKEEERLKDHGFLRVHHSYLINVSELEHYTPKYVKIAETEIPIGRAYKAAVLKQMS